MAEPARSRRSPTDERRAPSAASPVAVHVVAARGDRRDEAPAARPALANRMSSRANVRAPAPAAAAAPTIHVSIGRVEVRAIHPSEPARPARPVPETPRVTLGAYLRRHGT